MAQPLPEFVDPWRVCEQGRNYVGAYALDELARLTPLLASSQGEAAFALRFGYDDEHRLLVAGRVEANLSLICQRCLQPMDLVARAVVALSPVRGLEEAARLPEELDPLLVESDQLRLRDIVEDELIMAIPSIARHSESECRLMAEAETGEETERQHAANPFAVLASLKKSGDGGSG